MLQVLTGGNPGAYRRMADQLPAPPGGIHVTHLFRIRPYSTSLSRALSSIDYSEDRIEFNPPFPGAAIRAFFALRQDARTNVAVPHITYTNLSCTSVSLTSLQASGFQELIGPGIATDSNSNPDFSVSGNQIVFGYLRFNTNTVGPQQDRQEGVRSTAVPVNQDFRHEESNCIRKVSRPG
ncbi:MAG: hypothetical protein ACE5HD_06030 [Acidobacteriota bacterium]